MSKEQFNIARSFIQQKKIQTSEEIFDEKITVLPDKFQEDFDSQIVEE